jgi:hypothetical protein
MARLALVTPGSVLIVMLSGCLDFASNNRLEVAANALSHAADECLYDVRDRKLKYESAPNCTALSALSTQYIEAGGFDKNTPAEYQLIAEQARTVAWMARAISASGNPALRIW